MTSRVDVRALEGGGGLHDLAQGHVCAPRSRLRETREGGGSIRENIKPLFGGEIEGEQDEN